MNDTLWILTEEKPKKTVINQIITLFCRDFNDKIILEKEIRIKPIFINGIFSFRYQVEGIKTESIKNIFLKVVSGYSSFVDYLVFWQQKEPKEENLNNRLIMAIEETKTSDDESRNTGIYQRSSKFVFISLYYPNVNKYMLYNNECNERIDKKPSDTNIFGTKILLTLGVKIEGKKQNKSLKKFSSIDELIKFKLMMKKPPAGNIPIEINKKNKRIEISGRLSKPAAKGNIGHDPNIGALASISKCLRDLGWNEDIVITRHGVKQKYIDAIKGNNKFLYICREFDILLDNIRLPTIGFIPKQYWHYELNSEKVASILLHIVIEYYGMKEIYQNHAGCERGYFFTNENFMIALPKKDENNIELFLPDLIFLDYKSKIIFLIEGKKINTISNGLKEINNYDSIENEFIKKYYPEKKILRYLSIFGGEKKLILNKKILFHLTNSGKIFLNNECPKTISDAFKKLGALIFN